MSVLRRTGATTLTTLAAAAAAFTALAICAPQWSRAAGFDFWNAGEAYAIREREQQRAGDIVARQEHLNEQIAAGEAVISALVDERLTLAEATEQMIQINLERPGFAETMTIRYGDSATYEERVTRFVLDKLRLRLGDNTSRLEEVLCRAQAR
jgi:hypothetical protein